MKPAVWAIETYWDGTGSRDTHLTEWRLTSSFHSREEEALIAMERMKLEYWEDWKFRVVKYVREEEQ